MSGYAIVTTDVSVEYATSAGSITALRHRAMEVAGGASVAVMGPSGCGKSTLLALLAGLSTPTKGSVTIGDTAVSALSERERTAFRCRRVGMVYQTDNLLPHLTVTENVLLPAAIAGGYRGTGDAFDPGALLARLGLLGLEGRFPDELSGGQRQRVAVARAVVHRPQVILADEPTGALDKANALAVITLLVEVQRDIGATLVVVTHDPEIARHTDRTETLRRATDRQDDHAG